VPLSTWWAGAVCHLIINLAKALDITCVWLAQNLSTSNSLAPPWCRRRWSCRRAIRRPMVVPSDLLGSSNCRICSSLAEAGWPDWKLENADRPVLGSSFPP
jgi:hypothetical protein